jgi:hypothetical protein
MVAAKLNREFGWKTPSRPASIKSLEYRGGGRGGGHEMFETVIVLTATGILVVEFIEWRQKGEQYFDAATNQRSCDWTMRGGAEDRGRRVVTLEGRK